MLITIILLYLLGNLYVFWRLWTMMPPNALGYASLIAFASVAILSLFIFFLAGDSMPVALSSFFYAVGSSWLFILLYFFIILSVNDLIGLSNKLLHFMPSDALTRYTKDNWIGLIFIAGFVTMLMLCGYMKYQWKVRVGIPIQTEKSLGDRESLRIVAISDLHLGYGIGRSEFEDWISMINNEKPDLIIIAGDIIDNSMRPLNEQKMYESFRTLEAPLGIYSCLGNHEYISGAKECMDFMDKAGITLLRDNYIEVDSSLCIIGRDDRSNRNRKSLETLTEGLDKSKYTILLDHQPFDIDAPSNNGIDLSFFGHTHQGQVWPVSLITKKMYQLDHGHKKIGQTDVIVSSGIGIWGGKFRIGTQSEYIVIDITRK